jgi:integrase
VNENTVGRRRRGDGVDAALAPPRGEFLGMIGGHGQAPLIRPAGQVAAGGPAAGVRLPRPGRKRPVYLTHQQVTALAAASGHYEGLVQLLAYTGLRWGEAVGLRIHDLDMLRPRASISENAVQSGTQIYIGTPKAHNQRTVPLPESCWHAWPASARAGDAATCCSPATTASAFAARTRCRAGSRRPSLNPTFRAPRRTICATLQPVSRCQPGANVKAVQKMLGHASAAMSLGIYAELFDDDLEAVATAVHDARTQKRAGQNVGTGRRADQPRVC